METTSEDKLLKFVKDLREEKISIKAFTEGEDLSENTEDTYPDSTPLKVCIKPHNQDEIGKVLSLLNSYGISFHVVSQGKNWGYGSKKPYYDQTTVLIDLSSMINILEFNQKYGYIKIEPGVTYLQVFDFLREQDSDLLIATGGSSKDISVIGNTSERGIGAGLNGDRYDQILDMEVMLMDGSIINTAFPGKGEHLFKRHFGPDLKGLFTQSNFGIIISLTYELKAIPAFQTHVYLRLKREVELNTFLQKLHSLTRSQTVPEKISLYNNYRLLSFFTEFDSFKNLYEGDNVLFAQKVTMELGLENYVSPWNGDFAFSASCESEAKARIEIIKKELDSLVEVCDYYYSKDDLMDILNEKEGATDLNSQGFIGSFLLRKYLGIPIDGVLKQAYWRKPTGEYDYLNPTKDNCGIIWIAPIIPFSGDDINECISMVEAEVEIVGLQSCMSIITNQNSVYLFASIIWDRDFPEMESEAMKAYSRIKTHLRSVDLFSYRLSTHEAKTTGYEMFEIINKLKEVFDPSKLMSPNKYWIK